MMAWVAYLTGIPTGMILGFLIARVLFTDVWPAR